MEPGEQHNEVGHGVGGGGSLATTHAPKAEWGTASLRVIRPNNSLALLATGVEQPSPKRARKHRPPFDPASLGGSECTFSLSPLLNIW